MARTLEFIKEKGKTFKVESFRQEVNIAEVPKQIVWLENMIAAKEEELEEMKSDLEEVKKLQKQNDKKIS